jgi:hypothetical protein
MQRRPLLSGLSAAVLVSLLSGCAGLGGPRVITLDERELARLLARAFPLNRRVLDLLDLQLAAPQLQLRPDRHRLAVSLTLQAQERWRGGRGRGELAFDCALRYDAADATLRLAQVQVQRIDFTAGGEGSGSTAWDALAAQPGLAQRIGRILAEQLLENLVVYRVAADRLASLRRQGFEPAAVDITEHGVEITLARRGA